MGDNIKYSRDLNFVKLILNGDMKAWNRFVQRYSDRIWKRAWQLCSEACHNTQSVLFCIFHGLVADGVQSYGDRRPGCDEGLEIYVFIFDYLYNRGGGTGKLKFYDGRSRLDTFVTAVLYGNMRADWIRHKRHLRVDQITRPTEIKKLGVTEQKIFDQMVLQRKTVTIAKNLGLSVEEVEKAQSLISHELMVNDHLYLILRSPELPLEEEFSKEDVYSSRILPMRRALDMIWEKICVLIGELPENEKILMDMSFDQELDADSILQYVKKINLLLPVKPGNDQQTIHNIYQSIDHILRKLGMLLQQKYPGELENCLNSIDDDMNLAGNKISAKGLKILLKNMGIKTKVSRNGKRCSNLKENKDVRI